jgi:hypothetical protein
VTPEATPEAKVAEEKAAEAKRAEEKAVAEKAAEEKAAADKAAAKEPDPKTTDAKSAGDQPKEVAAVAPKSTDAPKAGTAKPTKLDPKTGILAKGEADKYAKKGARPVVRLLDAGAEPRSPAAYAIVKGTSKPLQMGMDLEMAMEAEGMKLPATKMPRLVLVFNFTTGNRAGTEWPIDGKLSKISVESNGPAQEQIAAALRPQLGSLGFRSLLFRNFGFRFRVGLDGLRFVRFQRRGFVRVRACGRSHEGQGKTRTKNKATCKRRGRENAR